MRTCLLAIASLVLALSVAAQKVAPIDAKAGQPQGQDSGQRWFAAIEKSLDVGSNATEVLQAFAFQNPGDTAVEWRELAGSCTCSSSTIRVADRVYEMKPKPKELVQVIQRPQGEQRLPVVAIPVGPHERGEVELHVEMKGYAGSKAVSLDIHTTDPLTPMIRLKLNAVGAKAIDVQPAEIDLHTLAPGEKGDFTVRVSSPVQKDFEILGADPFPRGLEATWDKAMHDGAAVWTITGSYRPTDVNATGGTLKFATTISSAKSFTVRVQAKVLPPVEVTPGFLSLGIIRKGTKATGRVRIHANDGTDLEAASMQLDKLSLPERFVSATLTKDGNALVIVLEVAADTPNGLVRGDLVVELNHATVKQQRILFNGFVR